MSKTPIPRLYDFQLMEIFTDLLTGKTTPAELDVDHISITIGSNLSFTISKDNLESDLNSHKEIYEHLTNSQSHSIIRISIIPRERRYTLSYARSEEGSLDHIILNESTSYGAPGYTVIDAIAVSRLNEILISSAAQHPHFLTNDPDNLSARSEVLAQLQKLSSDITKDQLEYRKALDIEKESFLATERQRTEARLNELSHDYKLQSEQLEEKYRIQDDLLLAREQAVNDADNTTTRRATTANVLVDVREKAESFEFSRSVARGRFTVLLLSLIIAFFGLINIAIGTAHFSSFPLLTKVASDLSAQPPQNDYTTWLAFAKIFGGSFIFISSIVYLIRYQSQWTNKAANVELDYQKFSRDLNRAHVAIEMCLEWNDKKEGQIPETLLNAMTNGLFTEHQSKNEEIMHPAEQLAAAMIRSAERIEFPLGTGKIVTKGKNIPKSAPSSP